MNTGKFVLTDRMWDKVKDRLPGRQGSPGRTAADNRLFLEAMLAGSNPCAMAETLV